jgi:hypothetical protein
MYCNRYHEAYRTCFKNCSSLLRYEVPNVFHVTSQLLHSFKFTQSQSHITIDSQSASLSWCQAPIWERRPIFPILSLIIFGQLRVCWSGVPPLTRSRVYSFQFLPGITSAAFLRSESHVTHEHSLLPLFLRLPQPGGLGSCIHFLQE